MSSRQQTALETLLKSEPTLAAEMEENPSYYRPLIERRRRAQPARRQLPCAFFGGHDWQWHDARKDYGLWFVKKSCERCYSELDYQIGSSSEDGRRWSSEGGSSPPPRASWSLRPYQHPQGLKHLGQALGGLLLIGLLATIAIGLVLGVVTLFYGLAQDIEMSERPKVTGRLMPGHVATAFGGEYYWEESDPPLPFVNFDRERYSVTEGQFQYRWQRCMNGGCHDIAGATGVSYTIKDTDAGKYLRVIVKIGAAEGKLLSKDIPPHASKPRPVSRG